VYFFFTLVITQFGNVCSIRTRHFSFFQHPPFFNRNKDNNNYKILFAILCSFSIALLITEIPWFHHLFKTRSVPIKYIGIAFIFPFILFAYDEIRKLLIRKYPYSCIAKIAW